MLSGLVVASDVFSPNEDRNKDYINISFTIKDNYCERSYLSLGIYDQAYNPVKTFYKDSVITNALFNIKWDGKDDFGNVVGHGVYNLKVSAKDYVGNIGNTFNVNISVDLIKPLSLKNVTLKKEYLTTIDSLTINFDLEEEGDIKAEIFDESDRWISTIWEDKHCSIESESQVLQWKDESLQDGNYYCKITVFDEAGNLNNEKINFIKDSVSPVIEMDNDYSDLEVKGIFTISENINNNKFSDYK